MVNVTVMAWFNKLRFTTVIPQVLLSVASLEHGSLCVLHSFAMVAVVATSVRARMHQRCGKWHKYRSLQNACCSGVVVENRFQGRNENVDTSKRRSFAQTTILSRQPYPRMNTTSTCGVPLKGEVPVVSSEPAMETVKGSLT
jgi:hypothetical protein